MGSFGLPVAGMWVQVFPQVSYFLPVPILMAGLPAGL